MTVKCAEVWFEGLDASEDHKQFPFISTQLILAASESISESLPISTIQRLVMDTFKSTINNLLEHKIRVRAVIFPKLVSLSHHLIKIGRANAKNIILKLEKEPLICLRAHHHNVKKILQYIKNLCSEDDSLNRFVQETIEEFEELEEKNLEKFYRPPHAYFDRKAIVNLTDTVIPEDIALAFSFGPKFCFPPKSDLLNTVELLDDFCFHLENNFPIETHFEAYKQMAIEFNQQTLITKRTREVWLDFLMYRIAKFARNNPDLLITRSDKGKHTTIIDKCMYEQKMKELVEATNDYVMVKDFDIRKLELKNNQLVNILKMNKTIKPENIYQFIDNNCFVAQLYGLIKVHKKDSPMRPIVAACSAPGFKLAKLITSMLSSIFHEKGYHARDSTDFVQQVNGQHIEQNECMISFDVISMFTNLPIDHLISIIETRKDLILKRFNINFSTLRTILIFILKECAVFSWNNTIYRQKDSLAMGSPLSPILAKILMTHLIDSIMPDFLIKPKILVLYVDDSFWVVNNSQVEPILTALNAYHSKIKFTLERETISDTGSSLDFLDISVYRYNEKLSTKWRPRPSSSSRLLNYFSHHEKTSIVETAKAFIRRILLLSHDDFFQENKVIIENILRANSFPETEITGLMHDNYSLMKPYIPSEKFKGTYVPIKYRGTFTSRLKNKIHPFLSKARLVGTPDRGSSNYFSYLKDSIEHTQKTNVVIISMCECRKKKIIRHTDFSKRAQEIFNNLPYLSKNWDDKCLTNTHCFQKFRIIQCKNFSSARRKAQLLAYYYKKQLLETKIEIPIFKIYKTINTIKITTRIIK